MENVKNIDEIRKEKIKKFKESRKRCLIRRIENGYIVSTDDSVHIGFYGYDEEDSEEDKPKKEVEEYYFNTLQEVLMFVDEYYSKSK